MKRSITFVVPSFYPAFHYGGPIVSGRETARALARLGHTVEVHTTNSNGSAVLDVPTNEPVEVDPGVFVHYHPRRMGPDIAPALLRALPAAVRNTDIVHLTGVYSFTTLPTLAAARAWGRPVVWSPRGALQSYSVSRGNHVKTSLVRLSRAIAPSALLLHTTSSEECRDAARFLPSIPACVIANGVAIPSHPRSFVPSAALRLLFVGRLHPVKALDHLLDAAALLSGNWQLSIAGEGDPKYKDSLRNQANRLGISSRVAWLGQVDDARRAELYDCHDLFVAPSHSENFGLAIAEALAAGMPVLASRGTPWTAISDVGAGAWVDNDASTLVATLETLRLTNLVEAGLRGRRLVEETLSWDRCAASLATQYEQLLSKK